MKIRMGFNTSGNLQTSGRNYQSVSLGKTRSTVGSITRKFNYCNRYAPSLNQSYNCTFDIFPPAPPVPFDPIEPSDGNYITIVSQDGYILVSSDIGVTFVPTTVSPTPITNLFQVTMSFDGKYQIVSDVDNTTLNSIAISNNYGVSFSEPQTPPSSNLAFISLASSRTGQYQTCVSKQTDNLIYTSSDYGNTWSQPSQPDGKTANFGASLQIICTNMNYSGNRQLALTVNTSALPFSSSIYESDDYGQSWYLISTISSVTLFSLWVSDDSSITSAGELGNGIDFPIWYSNNLGVNWTRSTFDGDPSLIPPAIFTIQTSFDGITQIAAGGYSYGQYITPTAIFISRNGGKNWDIAPSVPTDLYWLSVSLSKRGKIMVAVACDSSDDVGFTPNPTANFYFYISKDSGYTWTSTTLAYPGVGIYIN